MASFLHEDKEKAIEEAKNTDMSAVFYGLGVRTCQSLKW